MATENGLLLPSRLKLEGLWQFCSTPPDQIADESQLDAANLAWTTVEGACTAAEALIRTAQWSLDGTRRNFDAEDWWFKTTFDDLTQANDCCSIVFGGLATLATVWLNGQRILDSENMFLAHSVDVTRALQPRNVLTICCRSLKNNLKARRPRPRWKVPMLLDQQLRWIRTTLLGRTPGWSPPVAVVGIWRPVWLERTNELSIKEIQLQATVEQSVGIVECKLLTVADVHSETETHLCVRRNGREWTAPLRKSVDDGALHALIRIDQPDLWWPHTHGDPALYSVFLRTSGTEKPLGDVGFRSIELDTSNGQFTLFVNGERIFCRGACWTPLNIVTLHSSTADYLNVLRRVASAGMNMLRIPGTMVYEDEHFFEMCDRLGILVWQDFMFANMDYPDDPSFVTSVTSEVTQQLAALRAHPSVAVLCGNSEVEQQAAMWGAPRALWAPPLFHEVLARLVAQSGIDVPYWPSSAHGGAFPHEPNSGTTSYYGVGAYLRPLDDARRSGVRFASECLAFANVPSNESLSEMPGGLTLRAHHPDWKARVPRDLNAGWDFEDVRDAYLAKIHNVNPVELRSVDHERYLELSRVVSGEVMASAFTEWRRFGSQCCGALVLFLKDLWHGAGWGLLDADGDAKAALFLLSRVMRSRAVLLTDEGCGGLSVHLVNEHQQSWIGKLQLSLFAYRAEPTVVSHAFEVPPRGTLEISAVSLLEYFADLNHAYRFGPSAYEAIVATAEDASGARKVAFHFTHSLAAFADADTGLECTATQAQDQAILTLRTKTFARYVTIEIDGFDADDQYFHVCPNEVREIRLTRRRADARLDGYVRALNARTPVRIQVKT